MVDTGDGWGPNAVKTITPLKPACTVLRFGDLASRPFDWPDLVHDEPEDLSFRHEPFSLRPHQKVAFDNVTGGFNDHDRGKLIMACGTGKTFAALRIAEAVAGIGGRVLYLVPSISLFQQSMREWATQRSIPHRYIGICSDTRAGRNDEDASLQELEIPVTTDPKAISQALRGTSLDAMTVVFCTYLCLLFIHPRAPNLISSSAAFSMAHAFAVFGSASFQTRARVASIFFSNRSINSRLATTRACSAPSSATMRFCVVSGGTGMR